MEYMEKKGWDVHVIDLSPITIPDAYNIVRTGLIDHPKRELFHSKKEYREYARSIPDGAVFVLTTDFVYYIYFAIKCIRVTQYYGYMTRIDTNVEPETATVSDRIKGLFNKNFMLHAKNAIFTRIPWRFLPVEPADFIWLGGKENRDSYLGLEYTDAHTRVRHLHSMDYEQYLELKENNEKLIEYRYAVFIDDYLPYHPDCVSMGVAVNPDTYYELIINFLGQIEKRYGVKCVIAAHPRSNLDLCKNIYDGFEVRKFETAALVKDSELVISHFSTALDFAAVFFKPVIICSTTEILKVDEWYSCVHKYADYFGVDPINLSDKTPDELTGLLPEKLEVDMEKYRYFIQQYMKAEIDEPDKHLGELIYCELVEMIDGGI